MSTTFDDSAYIVLINDDNSMTATKKRRIVQRSKMVDTLWFLVRPEYNGHNMADFTVLLEYLAPVSRKYRTEFLTLCSDTYNGYLKYTLPFNTNLTAEAGEIELTLTFLRAELDENGKGIQRSRKITGTKIQVVPISAWSDIIPDCALSALDQRIIKMDAQIRAIDEASAVIISSKADNISYNEDSKELQLTSDGKPIGDKIILNNVGFDEDGLPVVDFSGAISDKDTEGPGDSSGESGGNDNSGSSDSNNDDNSSDVVEF